MRSTDKDHCVVTSYMYTEKRALHFHDILKPHNTPHTAHSADTVQERDV